MRANEPHLSHYWQARTARGHESGGGGPDGDANSEEGESADMVWARLLSFYDAGFLLSASVGAADEGEAAPAEAMGLLLARALTLAVTNPN